MAQTVEQLLEIAGRGARWLVEKTKDRWRQQIQDLVRNLTGLRLTSHRGSEREAARLKIYVDDGLPESVKKVSLEGDKNQQIRELLGFHRSTFIALKEARENLLNSGLFDSLRELGFEHEIDYRNKIGEVQRIAEMLLKEAK